MYCILHNEYRFNFGLSLCLWSQFAFFPLLARQASHSEDLDLGYLSLQTSFLICSSCCLTYGILRISECLLGIGSRLSLRTVPPVLRNNVIGNPAMIEHG